MEGVEPTQHDGKIGWHAGIKVMSPEEFQMEATMVACRNINISCFKSCHNFPKCVRPPGHDQIILFQALT